MEKYTAMKKIDLADWTPEDKAFLDENWQILIREVDNHNTILSVGKELGFEWGEMYSSEGKDTETTTGDSRPSSSERALQKTSWLKSEEFKGLNTYMENLNKETGDKTRFNSGTGRVPNWIVKRPDFKEQFPNYPAASYRQSSGEGTKREQKWLGLKGEGQADIFGQGEREENMLKVRTRYSNKFNILEKWKVKRLRKKGADATKDFAMLKRLAEKNNVKYSNSKLAEYQEDFSKNLVLPEDLRKLIEDNQDNFSDKLLYLLDLIDIEDMSNKPFGLIKEPTLDAVKWLEDQNITSPWKIIDGRVRFQQD